MLNKVNKFTEFYSANCKMLSKHYLQYITHSSDLIKITGTLYLIKVIILFIKKWNQYNITLQYL